jgi:hypothetical protein
MLRFIKPALLGGILALSACSPALNWRAVAAGPDGALKLLLPCKPDRASRPMPLGGETVELHMLGCEADGTLFAVSWVELGDASRSGPVLAQWQAAMLATLRADAPQTLPFTLKGADAQPAAVRVRASGLRANGTAVQAQGVWFARGARVFHAVMYADTLNADGAETFFSGLEFQ